MGRHYVTGAQAAPSARRRRIPRIVLGIALIALLVAGVIAIVSGRAGGCSTPTQYSVMADPALASALRSGADAGSDGCTTFAVSEVPDSQVAGRLTGGGDTPDLWLAPSRTRQAAVAAQVGRDLPGDAVTASPIVLAGTRVEAPDTWLSALQAPTIRAVPADSPFASAPVSAVVGEAEKTKTDERALTASLAQYAQAAKRVTDDPVRAAAADGGVVAVPEYAYLAAKKSDDGLAATVPRSGAPREDQILAVTATGEREAAAKDAAAALTTALTSSKGRDALAREGLRGTDLTPAPSGGVGQVAALPDPDAKTLETAQKAYSALAIPFKAIIVVDTSGSMAEASGDTTRIGMLTSGFSRVVSQIPGNNALGLWTFSVGTGSRPDWTEVVPTADLSTQRGDKTQRQALLDAAKALPGRVEGATGLYDTTLAAYQRAVQDYDPAYSNSVILLTDGADEKNGGISQDTLISRLKGLVDPARPVNIHTVGISKDADLPALKLISDATGGTAQSADTEQQMLTDFVNAIARRAK